MTSSLTALRTPSTLQPPPTPTRTTRFSYRLAHALVLLGLAAACALAALGAITAPDQTGDLGATAKVVRYAEPTATGRAATRWNPATDAIITVRVPEAPSPAVAGG